jgi:hypothetical protein
MRFGCNFPFVFAVMKRSKTSLTNEEIEAFWHHQQEEIEAHSKEINDQVANTLPVGVILSIFSFSRKLISSFGRN